jgi:hypothetical protein
MNLGRTSIVNRYKEPKVVRAGPVSERSTNSFASDALPPGEGSRVIVLIRFPAYS